MRHPYYKYDKVCSYNGTYNFVVGARGFGKTYGAKLKALKAAIYKQDQFIYLRRYKPELQAARNTFFADILDKFPNWDFRVNGNEAQTAPAKTRADKKRVWRTIGYFIALSTAQSQKSVSFPRVKTIIFDEFIIEKGLTHYLPDESNVFNNFYSTVDRGTDKTTVWFLANSVSIMNPYFLAYEIAPDSGDEIITKHDNFIVCHFPESEAFSTSIYETKFGKFIKGTEYADYAVGNTFKDNHEALLNLKPPHAKYLFTLESKLGTFSVWNDSRANEYWVQEKLPKTQVVFTLIPERMREGIVLMTFTDRPLAYLRTAYRQARMAFDSPKTRNAFVDVFKR